MWLAEVVFFLAVAVQRSRRLAENAIGQLMHKRSRTLLEQFWRKVEQISPAEARGGLRGVRGRLLSRIFSYKYEMCEL